MQNIHYLVSSALQTFSKRKFLCPSCGGVPEAVVDRKWLVTSLRRCGDCGLLFRAPTTSALENERLYQGSYRQGFTTELPSAQELAALLRRGFSGHEKDYAPYLAVLNALGARPGMHLVDFGCSWGYGSYQLQQAGYVVDACEISRARAQYARDRLGIRVRELAELRTGHYDLFFSAHVIEHAPSVSDLIRFGLELLRPDGLFVAFTPNQSEPRRRRAPDLWHRQWGLVHPQVLDSDFLQRLPFPSVLGATSPYDLPAIARWDRRSRLQGDMSGDELLLVIRKIVS